MKNFFVLFIITLTLSACVTMKKRPSVCENLTGPSQLCKVAESHDMRLESIGALITIANAVAIGEGSYTVEEAITIAEKMRSILNNPVSYLFFSTEADRLLRNYPLMLDVAKMYIAELDFPQVMHTEDARILKEWLDTRLRSLRAIKYD